MKTAGGKTRRRTLRAVRDAAKLSRNELLAYIPEEQRIGERHLKRIEDGADPSLETARALQMAVSLATGEFHPLDELFSPSPP